MTEISIPGIRRPRPRRLRLRLRLRLVLLAAVGFTVGCLAGWAAGRWGRLHQGLQPSASLHSKIDRSRAEAASPDAEKRGAAAAAWEALSEGGQAGLALYLSRSGLILRARAGELPELLKLAEGDRNLRKMLLRRWADLDPAAAGKWVLTQDKDEDEDEEIGLVFGAWAKKDPAAAMAGLRADSRQASQLFFRSRKVLNRLLDEDPEAGVRFGTLSGPSRSLDQRSFLVRESRWVEKDPAGAAALLSALPPGEFRDNGISRALNELSKKDFAAALALWEKFPDPGVRFRLNPTRGDFYREWARRDPEALSAYMNEKADAFERRSIKDSFAVVMGETDPAAALAWAQDNLQGGAEAIPDVFEKLTLEDPAAALTWLESLPAGTTLDSSVAEFVNALPEEGNPADILAQAQTLPEGPLRDSLTSKAWEKLYAKDPGALLRDLASRPAGELPPGIWTQLGKRTGDLKEGLEHLAAIPLDAAPEFVGALFESTSRDSGLSQFSSAMESLTVPEQRAAAMRGALRRLVFFDPAAVSHWAASLPAEERRFAAGLMEENMVKLTPNQKKELIDPLR